MAQEIQKDVLEDDFSNVEEVGWKALLVGEAGVGKTCSLRTLINTGQNVRFLAAENNAISGAKTAIVLWKKENPGKVFPSEQFQVCIPQRKVSGSRKLLESAEKSLTIPLEAQMKNADPNKKDYDRFASILKSNTSFISHYGKDLGLVDSWGTDTTLAIDSLTIICESIKKHVIGGKKTISQPEWGAMQSWLIDYLRMITEDLKCNVVLMAHPVKETDLLMGGVKIYPANLGQALNNLIPTYFSDVIWCYRNGNKYLWSTDDRQAVTRASNIPVKSDLPADFAQFFTH